LVNNKKILENLIKKKAILISDYDKPFKLSSGELSHYYYNSKNCILDPEGLDIISDLLLKKVRKFKVKSIGGIETGSIPLATAICLKSSLTESDPLSAFFVRKEPKRHGPQSDGPLAYFEGNPVSPIVIVDDVITTGKSVINKTLNPIKKLGLDVSGIVCIIDREQGAEELFKENNIEFYSLFKHSVDFKKYIDEKINESRKNYEQKRSKNLEVSSVFH
ncbi:MAG TPA: orotate phosphoribosyltransferase, partial [Nitrososphaeraceae archaeon]|nr:orotate phosphoribosyltransferase [Nitrososphaeraceae archaeon]